MVYLRRRNWVCALLLVLIFEIQIQPLLENLAATNIKSVLEKKDERSEEQTLEPQNVVSKPFRPGDAISISTFPDTSSFLNSVFPIDDYGYIELLLLGKVRITQMTVAELQNYLKNQFKAYLRYPNVLVKPLIRVSIMGGVPKPGLYYVDEKSSLWEVVRIAGGTTLEEGLKELHWERDQDDVVDDLIPYFQSGISLKRMGFKSGDQLWTPSVRPRTFFEIFMGDFLPLAAFVTTTFLLYWNFQVQIRLIEAGRSSR